MNKTLDKNSELLYNLANSSFACFCIKQEKLLFVIFYESEICL